MTKNNAAQELGRHGGLKTKAKYGTSYYSAISHLGYVAKRKKKEQIKKIIASLDKLQG